MGPRLMTDSESKKTGIDSSATSVFVLLGFMGMPLAFLALPLYVYLPHHDVQVLGLPMAHVGLIFLLARSLDALSDPLWGAMWDRAFKRNHAHVLMWCSWLSLALCLCFWALLMPQESCQWLKDIEPRLGIKSLGSVQGHSPCSSPALSAWIAVCLMLAGLLYSALVLAQQTWSARLMGGPEVQSRLAAWRETFGLLGVVLASVLWQEAPLAWSAGVFTLFMAAAMLMWFVLPKTHMQPHVDMGPMAPSRGKPNGETLWGVAPGSRWGSRGLALVEPLVHRQFRSLLAVFLLNGTASAIAATLFAFYVDDNLQSKAHEAYFLGVYFLAAALSCPVWLKVVERCGLVISWQLGMALSVVVFLFSLALRAGDVLPFYGVCALTGIALGADLVIASALLVQLLSDLGRSGEHEGRFLAWWQVVNKLNLALAAGLSLPLLSWWGYVPGVLAEDSVQSLILGYALLPCLMKALAFVFLWRWNQNQKNINQSTIKTT
jgi:Na+/melibiose symporter-like transporter